MKTIGFIGGLTWLSSVDYYTLLNKLINEKLGGANSCKILMYSVNFEEIKALTVAHDWDGLATMLSSFAKTLEKAGAECLLIGANTMHNIADKVQAAISIPLIHIVDATAKEITRQQMKKVALLGTKYTMQLDFFKDKLATQNIETIIPNETDIDYINECIYNEMSKGIFLPERKIGFLKIIESLQMQGAEGIILGCTEIPILIKQEDVSVPVLDTTLLHVMAALEFAI
jgi:aspartate racemase